MQNRHAELAQQPTPITWVGGLGQAGGVRVVILDEAEAVLSARSGGSCQSQRHYNAAVQQFLAHTTLGLCKVFQTVSGCRRAAPRVTVALALQACKRGTLTCVPKQR